MKLKHKKTFLSGVAVTLAGVLGIGALLQSGISVQASPAMMPGIEQIIKKTQKSAGMFPVRNLISSYMNTK